MQEENYKILGVDENASDEEIYSAYKKLKDKYLEDRFLEGELGNKAAKNLTKVQSAYDEIMEYRRENNTSNGSNDEESFAIVEQALKANNLELAQEKLDNISNRNGEWHYLQSVVFYKKNWYNESKKQLEIAMNIEPNNEKYSSAYTKLKVKMDTDEKRFHSGNFNDKTNSDNPNDNVNNRQMGNSSDDCLSSCATLCCMNMMCNMCCR